MHHNNATCDRSTITRFLRDDLTGAERAIFEEHLEVCDECRVALEHSAAEPELWIEARESLTSDEVSRDRHLDSSQTGADDRAALRPESAARSEIALGFLAPT